MQVVAIIAIIMVVVALAISSAALVLAVTAKDEVTTNPLPILPEEEITDGPLNPDIPVTLFNNTEPIVATLDNGQPGATKSFRLESSFPVTVDLEFGSFSLTVTNPSRRYIADQNGNWIFDGDAGTYQSIPSGDSVVRIETELRTGHALAITADASLLVSSGILSNTNVGALFGWSRDVATGLFVADAQGLFVPTIDPLRTTSTSRWGYSMEITPDGSLMVCTPQKATPVSITEILLAVVFRRSEAGAWEQLSSLYQTDSTALVSDETGPTDLAISSDGKTIAVGNLSDDGNVGSVAVFFSSDLLTWTQQGAKLVGTDVIGLQKFGNALSMSADGNTLVVGAIDDNIVGAIYTFSRSDFGVWTPVSGKIISPGSSRKFGSIIFLSADADTLVVSDPSASPQSRLWVYDMTGRAAQLSNPIQLSWDLPTYSCGGMSADGTIIFGADNGRSGTVDVFLRTGGSWAFQKSWVNPGPSGGNLGYGTRVVVAKNGGLVVVNSWYDSSVDGAGLFVYQ